jgi:hypothetical protein
MKRRLVLLGIAAVMLAGTNARAQDTYLPSEEVRAVFEELRTKLDRIVKRCNRENTQTVREAKAKIEELKGTRHGRLRIRHIIYTTSKKIRRHSRDCIEHIQEVCSQYEMILDELPPDLVTEDDFLRLEEICRRHIHRIRSHTQYLLNRLAPNRDSPESDGTADDEAP